MSKTNRIVVSVTNDLVTDQRVRRTCSALREAGYDVVLIGRRSGRGSKYGPTRHEVPHQASHLPHQHKMRLLFKRKALFYAEFNVRLFFKLLFMRADLFFANDTDTLLANYLAARLRCKPMMLDAHEMFPEVPELVGRPRVKAVWTAIEDYVFPRIARHSNMCAVTVCQSIADIYRDRYGLEMKVVRNVPMNYPVETPLSENVESLLADGRRVLLYQGAVNVGRGVDWMINAMPYLPHCHFVVAGVGDEYERLRGECHADNVTFLGRLAPEELHSLTKRASLGISLLENRGLNYYYSLPNRIADFVQGGVPVIATDFPEIRRVVAGYGIGELVPPAPFSVNTNKSEPPEPHYLADVIVRALCKWDNMPADVRQRRFVQAAADLSWDNDKKILLQQIKTIL